MGSFTPHRVHIASSQTIHPSHGHLPFLGAHNIHLRLRENDTPSSWASSLLKGTQRFISVSKRTTHPTHGHLPYTGAHSIPSPSQIGTTHPTHGLSLRPTHSVCVLENVSRNCNHQQLDASLWVLTPRHPKSFWICYLWRQMSQIFLELS
jgi:hypothetical protein